MLKAASAQNWIKAGAWSICLGIALLELWSGRFYTNPDAVSYLDLSDGLLTNNWGTLVNTYWSPLYPFLIGTARWIIHPNAYWELPVVHLTNFVIFLGALAAFEFFLIQVVRSQKQYDEPQHTEQLLPLSASMWTLLGYSLFAWSTFWMINVQVVTPDLCVAVCIYLDAGLMLRLRAGCKQIPTFIFLGVTLGLGYYAKAALFPMAFAFMVTALLVAGGWKKAALPSLLMFLVFAGVTAPLVIATSESAGHLTFGESGSNAYARLVGGEQTLPFYPSTPPPYLIHPLSKIHRAPDVYEFSHPFSVTYPLWYEVSYWDSGYKTRFDLGAQLRVLRQNVTILFVILVLRMAGPIVCFLFLLGCSSSRRFWKFSMGLPLIIPSAIGIVMYSFVLMESRYIAAFAVLVWMGLLSEIRFRKTPRTMRLATTGAVVFASCLIFATASSSAKDLVTPLPQHLDGRYYYQVGKALSAEGVQSGQAVAIIGSGFDEMRWARSAKLRIVAQIPPECADEFWRTSVPSVKAEVYAAVARAGATAVVTDETPPSGGFADWQRVGNTKYYVHLLAPAASK
jgi:ABC-type sugar transport system permease subunit